ncbi:MAG: SCO family protein [Sphingomonadaceae bacterium]|jgi:protein SCO1/2
MNRSAMWSFLRIFTSLLAPLALIACSGESAAPVDERPPLEGAAIGGAFTLVDENGSTVEWSDFKGRYRIIYFGYTFCPDACPLDVQAMMAGFSRFEDESPALAEKVQPIFVSIDPARDTPPIVGEFTAAFHPRLLGLTGTTEQVAAAAKTFAIYYQRGEDTPQGGYLMDHSRQAYLMDPEGKPIAILAIDKGPDAVAADLAKWVR